VLAVHPRRFQRILPTKQGQWLGFPHLVRELVRRGLLRTLPRDPGFGKDSLEHYVLEGNGRVRCRLHGLEKAAPENGSGW
jgi:hypothetical protein